MEYAVNKIASEANENRLNSSVEYLEIKYPIGEKEKSLKKHTKQTLKNI